MTQGTPLTNLPYTRNTLSFDLGLGIAFRCGQTGGPRICLQVAHSTDTVHLTRGIQNVYVECFPDTLTLHIHTFRRVMLPFIRSAHSRQANPDRHTAQVLCGQLPPFP